MGAPPAKAAGSRKPIVMTAFVQEGRTDVRRNELLVFKFSTTVKRGSVNDRTIRVAEITATGERNTVGARIVRGNVVFFDPTRTTRNYEASRKSTEANIEKDHTDGFVSFQDHSVELPALPDLKTVKNTHGDRLQLFYSGSFRTNGTYDDPVPGQPYFLGDHGNGLLGFDPPRSGATGLVDEDAIIILEFNEPIQVDTLDPGNTIIVTRVTVGEQVPCFVKQDPNEASGRRFLLIPSVGFGTDQVNQQGWDIQVQLKTGITDLAGNPLKRPITFPVFRTRFVAGKPSCSQLIETFANQTKMDPATVTKGGEWNTTEAGALRGGAPTQYPNVDVIYTVANTGVLGLVRLPGGIQQPLVAKTVPASGGGGCSAHLQGSRVQMLYVPADVGPEGAIVAVGWGPSSNALFAATYPSVTLRMSHTSNQSLSSDFEANVNIGTPQLCFKGEYRVPQAKNINGQPSGTDPVDANGVSNNPNATGMWDWPQLTFAYEWNGVNNIVFDAAVDGGDNCQILRCAFVPAGIAFPSRAARSLNATSNNAEFAVEALIYDARFKKRRRTTQGISLWYELASDNPIFAQPIISPVGQTGGVDVLLELQGAFGKPDPFNVGGFIADPTTATEWTTDVTKVDKHRFLRFRLSMFANLTTNQTAKVTSVGFPYCF